MPFASAVLVAAGRGERFGDSGKVLANVAGRPVLSWALDAFDAADSVRDVIIVSGSHSRAAIETLVSFQRWTKVRSVVPGGSRRQASMAAGVRATADDADVVLVHDAARPLIRPEQIDACADLARASGAAILVDKVGDTLKRVENGLISGTVDRSHLWAAQTPQAFQRDILIRICECAEEDDMAFTDEASIAEYLGIPVRIVEGDRTNLKITWPADLMIADALLAHRAQQS